MFSDAIKRRIAESAKEKLTRTAVYTPALNQQPPPRSMNLQPPPLYKTMTVEDTLEIAKKITDNENLDKDYLACHVSNFIRAHPAYELPRPSTLKTKQSVYDTLEIFWKLKNIPKETPTNE